jgi:ribosomal protein S18 acetylase RimI-like enzyme
VTHLRVATDDDVAAIAALHVANWRSAYRGLLSDAYLDDEIVDERRAVWEARFAAPQANQYTIVAEVDGEFAGFAHSYADEDAEWGTLLDNLHVASEYQGSGLGRALMVETARWVEAKARLPRFHLWVLEANTAARVFYERLGGRTVGSDVWEPPGGGVVADLRVAWTELDVLTLLNAR